MNDTYIRNNFDPKYKAKLDSLQTKLNREIADASDRYVYNPMVVKEGLVTQKLNLEIELELAANSVASIRQELQRLNRKFDALVPNEAQIQEYETGIDIASKEYMEALQRYNNATLESSFPVHLKQAEKALPGDIQPSKKLILLVLSGIVSLAFCLFILFVVYFFDKSIHSPRQLADDSNLPVLGSITHWRKEVSINAFRSESGSVNQEEALFRNLVRSVRYELDADKPGPKLIAVTSLGASGDKALLTTGLAWAFSKVNQRVLVVDGNFTNQEITKVNKLTSFVEDLFYDKNLALAKVGNDHMALLGNKGGDTSLREIAGEETIQDVLDYLLTKFDVILVETDSLKAMNKAKEWIAYAHKVVCVFEAGKSISDKDAGALAYFTALGDKFAGWVLTGATDGEVSILK